MPLRGWCVHHGLAPPICGVCPRCRCHPCLPTNPCMGNGTCVNFRKQGYTCDCAGTGRTGDHCQHEERSYGKRDAEFGWEEKPLDSLSAGCTPALGTAREVAPVGGAAVAAALRTPRALAWRPDAPDELWVANAASDSMLACRAATCSLAGRHTPACVSEQPTISDGGDGAALWPLPLPPPPSVGAAAAVRSALTSKRRPHALPLSASRLLSTNRADGGLCCG